jgi:hypothetical protein
MGKATMNATVATMIYTDGTRTVYAVYRCRVNALGTRREHVNLNARTTVEVGTVERFDRPGGGSEELRDYYRDLVIPYETPEFPAYSLGDARDRMERGWTLELVLSALKERQQRGSRMEACHV